MPRRQIYEKAKLYVTCLHFDELCASHDGFCVQRYSGQSGCFAGHLGGRIRAAEAGADDRGGPSGFNEKIILEIGLKNYTNKKKAGTSLNRVSSAF